MQNIGNRGGDRWLLVWVTYVKFQKSEKMKHGLGVVSPSLVQNDQRNCRNVFKRVLAKDSSKKNGELYFS